MIPYQTETSSLTRAVSSLVPFSFIHVAVDTEPEIQLKLNV